jgi:hypothetical protein
VGGSGSRVQCPTDLSRSLSEKRERQREMRINWCVPSTDRQKQVISTLETSIINRENVQLNLSALYIWDLEGESEYNQNNARQRGGSQTITEREREGRGL